MTTPENCPVVLMVMLCMRCSLGGAEKRYARVFKMLVAQPGARHKLLINRAMLALLEAAGIFSQAQAPHLIVLDPPFRRLVRAENAGGLIGRWLRFVLTALDVLWFIWQYGRVVGRLQPDVVHPLLTGMYLSLPVMLFKQNIRYVMSDYSTLFRPREYMHTARSVDIAAGLKRYALQRCHAIDALTPSIRDNLLARDIDDAKIHVAPCSFTDVSLCKPAEHRARWVVFVARLIEYKNPLLFARAIPKILEQAPDARFYILGRGPLQAELESLVRSLDIDACTTIRFDPRPTQILNQSSIFVSLQAADNYPSQSLLEAMACGNAIVATDVGETWRLVDETNGARVPASSEAIAGAIVRLLNDPQLPQYQRASRERVLNQHTPERFFDYIAGVYWNPED